MHSDKRNKWTNNRKKEQFENRIPSGLERGMKHISFGEKSHWTGKKPHES